MISSRFLSAIFSAGVALMAFGAVYWPTGLGYLAASPGVLLITVSVALLPLTPKPLRSRTSLNAWRLLGYGVLISALSVLIFGWSPLYASKSLSLLLLSAVWIAPLLCIDHLQKRHLRRALIAAVGICFVGYLLGDIVPGSMPAAISSMAFGGGYDDYLHTRARGFMQENSHFAALLGRYLLILFLLNEASRTYSARRLTLFMVALATLLAFLGSKGSAVSIAAAVLSVSLTRRQLPYLVILAPLLWWVGETQFEALSYDIENFTSTSTRLTLALGAIAAMLSNPLGYGYYGFYGAIQKFGGWSMGWLGERLPLVTTELTEIVEDLINVSAKSTLLDFGIVWGLPFVLILIGLFRRINHSDPRARVGLVYLTLSALATSGHDSISFFLGLAVLVRLFPKLAPGRGVVHGKRDLRAQPDREAQPT